MRSEARGLDTWGSAQPKGLAKIARIAIELGIVRGALKRPLYQFINRKSGPIDVDFRGLKFRCHVDTNGPERFIIFQKRRALSAPLKHLLDLLEPGNVFVDVGANFGLFSILGASQVGSNGLVIAIEPHPELLRRLSFNARINGMDQIKIFGSAVGDENGEARLYLAPSFDLAMSSMHCSGQVQTRSILVPVTLLSNILSQADVARIDALKIDVEGYEDRALIPFIDQAPTEQLPKFILIEVKHSNNWKTDCISELKRKGYSPYWQSDSDFLLRFQES